LLIQPTKETLTWAIGVTALQGLYSLSFLELWALGDRSYSIRILAHIRKTGSLPVNHNPAALQQIGERKKSYRLKDLVRLGLVERNSNGFVLTTPGRWLARGLGLLLWLSNTRRAG